MNIAGANVAYSPSVRAALIVLVTLGAGIQAAGLFRGVYALDAVSTDILLHVAGSAMVAVGLRYFTLDPRHARAWIFLMIFGFVALVFPVAGALLGIAFSFIFNRAERLATTPDHVIWEEGVTNALPGHSVTADIDALKIGIVGWQTTGRGEDSPFDAVSRLVQRMRDDDPLVRRKAVIPLINLRYDHAAPMLKNAMDDEDEQVRLMAQNALQSIRDRFETIIQGLREAVARESENPYHYLRLADAYTALAGLDLEKDTDISVSYGVKASSWIALAAGTPSAGKDPELTLELLKRSLAMRRFDLARRFSAQLEGLGMDDIRLEESLLEMAFEDKRWDMLLRKLAAMPGDPISRPDLRYVSKYWLQMDGGAAL